MIIYEHGVSQLGHVEGIIQLYQEAFAYTMGCNTTSGPGIEVDGEGAYFKMRTLLGPVGDMKIYGYLRPFPGVAPSATAVKADE